MILPLKTMVSSLENHVSYIKRTADWQAVPLRELREAASDMCGSENACAPALGEGRVDVLLDGEAGVFVTAPGLYISHHVSRQNQCKFIMF